MHVGETAAGFLEQLKSEWHFNEVPVDLIQYESTWHAEYAIFIVDFETWDLGQYFDYAKFYYDWQKHVKERFPGCEIIFHHHTDEIEVIGPNYKEFKEKYGDQWEEFELNKTDGSYDTPCIFYPKE